ncbi:MAG TPA: copper resistance CopC family protein [Gemmatimonadales bacterium]|nr:copper resistance CopC family protein [Gemmatimonadales bacterium]
MMKTLRYAGLGAVMLLGTAAMFHNHLVKSSPAAGESLPASPAEVRLWFNEPPEIPFTSVTLLTADSTKIVTIKAVKTDDSMAVAAPLAAPLKPGAYLITWRTAGSDGHAIRGTYGFSIAP